MTIFDLHTNLLDRFYQLNEVSGKTYIKDNVSIPNNAFESPLNKIWFEINFLNGTPENTSLGNESLDRYKDILQIDICDPTNKEKTVKAIFEYLLELFEKGTEIGDYILVDKIWLSNQVSEKTYTRYQIRISWTADI